MIEPDDLADIEPWLNSSPIGKKLFAQLSLLRHRVPEIFLCLDLHRLYDQENFSFLAEVLSHPNDFEPLAQGGRGDAYTKAQRNSFVRACGIQTLFRLCSPRQDLASFTPEYKIIDILGGDGLLTRVLSSLLAASSMPGILTSDLSEYMVMEAQRYGLAALQQPAHYLLLKDKSFDAVIIAYGAHHIPPSLRLQMCQESFRVLKPGGRIILHDFEVDSPVARWFEKVVSRYSLTGHNYAHFSKQEMEDYLSRAGFQFVTVHNMYDPFAIQGSSVQEVQRMLGEYLLDMYGLVKLASRKAKQPVWQSVYDFANDYFRYDYQVMGLDSSFGKSHITWYKAETGWRLEMPRVALISSAIKGS